MENLWAMVVKRKYIDLIPMDEWLRNLDKRYPQASIVWKETLDSIKIIKQGILWHVGNGEKIRLGQDPWVGCNEGYALSREIINHLKSRGVYSLSQIEKVGQSKIWDQAWKLGGSATGAPVVRGMENFY